MSNGAFGAGFMALLSRASNTSRGTSRVVPWTRAPATSRHHRSADARASSRLMNDSPSNQLSRTYAT
ncbi:hypothetical protein BE15_21260 [Sorangium cellulosum]|uniref:Uncharacterized protein n=1 Tax=Sorangium cellulosum TaxID=56 RepID=A0A150Q4D5_SORCE|nr:hypothetical protein BE15_21260 [Sorangium cellulosum]